MDTKAQMSPEAVDSLRWWSSLPRKGRSLSHPLPNLVLATDASMKGWGAKLGNLSVHGFWTREDQTYHINFLELKTVYYAVCHWKVEMSNQIVALQLDNTTAVAYLLKEGGTQSMSLCKLASEILILSEFLSIDLRPSYLPGRMNMEADALSRHQDLSEWMLDPVIAQNLFLRFGRPKIDLFASAQTRQVRRYFSADLRDLTALGIDAFLRSWEDLGSPLYAFPPPMLIPLVLARVHQLSAQKILITQWWPRAHWLPELMTMSVCIPYRLPIHQTSVIDVTSNTPLAELDKLRMTAWLISAESFKNEASHLIWPPSYSRHGDRPHSNHTHQHGICGVDGVADRAWTLLPLLQIT